MSIVLKGNKFLSIFGLFEPIKNRYGMYFYRKNIFELEAFISGINFILNQSKINPNFDDEHKLYFVFREFIVQKLNYIDIYNLNSNNLLLIASDNDDSKAFDLFFELWDEFVKEKEIIFEWEEENT